MKTSHVADYEQRVIALVDELFRDGRGDEADRLCLYNQGVYLGGWAKQPLIDRITTLLQSTAKERDAEMNTALDLLESCLAVFPHSAEGERRVLVGIDVRAFINKHRVTAIAADQQDVEVKL